MVAPVMDEDDGCSLDSAKFGRGEVLLAGTDTKERLDGDM